MKTKKTLAVLLAVMMILSSVPMLAFAAETPTVTTWPTATMEVGQLYTKAIIANDGVASVPGVFTITMSGTRNAPGNFNANAVFTPEDTENYTTVTGKIAVTATPCTNPIIDGTCVGTTIECGQAISNSVISLSDGSSPVFHDRTFTKSFITSYTWDNPDEVFTAAGTYERPITIAFRLVSGVAVAVDLKTTATVTVTGDGSEINPTVYGAVTSWPTIDCPEWTPGMTVADLTLTGGEATVEGTFAIKTSETTILKPKTTTSIKVAFTPADSEVEMITDTTKTIQITPTFTVKDITVTVDPDFVCTYEYGTKHLGKLSGASAFGITTDVPSDIKVNVFVSSAVDKDGNKVGTQDVYLTPGEYTARIAVSTSPVKVSGVGDVQLYNSPIFIENIPIVITKQTSTKAFGNLKITGTDEDEGQSTATIYYDFPDAEGVDGHCVLKVNGETVLDNIAPIDTTIYSTYKFTTNTSGKFTATLEYIPAETDYVEFETTVLSQEFELEVLKSEDPIIPGGDDNDNPDLDIDWGDLTEGDSDNPIVNIFNNILAWFRSIIETIRDFFRGIGDRT